MRHEGPVGVGESSANNQRSDNYLADAREQAILLIDVADAIVENNFLSTVDESFNGLPTPFVAFGSTAIVVAGNERQGRFVGAVLPGSASGCTVTGNCIRDGRTQGTASVPVPRDAWLAAGSANNSVTERIGTTVVDDGASNSVIPLVGDSVDYCHD